MKSVLLFAMSVTLLAGPPSRAATPTSVSNSPVRLDWGTIPPLPDPLGVAAPFAGVSDGALLVAGGANFPAGYPWQGGKKAWHDAVYVLTGTNASWQSAGKLPRPLAYGVSLTTPDGVLCAGGSDATRHYAEVFLLQWSPRGLVTRNLPSLPVPLANAAGALVGSTVFIAAGADQPGEVAALNRCFVLDLAAASPQWQEIEPLPGKARILPVAAAVEGAFYLAGGAALESTNGHVARVYLRDAWRYRAGEGWRRLADLPKPSVAAPSPAPTVDGSFLLVGGDDGSLAGFQPVEKHPGFPRAILAYDTRTDAWRLVGELPAARATVPAVAWRGGFVIPSGEARPGVRSPQVWTFRAASPP
jgi:N-acetylneuraminate epimerase